MRFTFLNSLILITTLLAGRPPVSAEPLRIVYTAISLMYGPLWVTQDAGIFKKHNLDVELLYLSGGTLSTAALISGDVQIAFTGAANVVSANLTGSDVVLLGATIDLLPFEVWSVPTIKEPSQLKGTKMGVTRIGSTTHFVARYALKQFGLRPDTNVTFFRPVDNRNCLRPSREARSSPLSSMRDPLLSGRRKKALCGWRTLPPWGGPTSTEAWPLVSLLSGAGLT